MCGQDPILVYFILLNSEMNNNWPKFKCPTKEKNLSPTGIELVFLFCLRETTY